MKQQAARGRMLRSGVAAAIVIGVAALGIAGRDVLARAAIGAGAATAAHVRVSLGAMQIGPDQADFSNVSIDSMTGEPIGRIDRVAVGYDLRSLLPGSRHLFGLTSLLLTRPQLFVVRHRDGSYNVPKLALPQSRGAAGTPMNLTAAVERGSIELLDEGNVDPHQRHLSIENIGASALIATDARSLYSVRFDYGERSDALYPVRGSGDIDPSAGYAVQHWTARELPIAGAVDYALNSPSLHLAAGELRDLDARVFGFADAGGSFSSHLAAGAYLQGARVAIGGLAKPVRDARGWIAVDDDGLLSQRIDATLAGIPVRARGGVYGLDAPQFRLAVDGAGDLDLLRSAVRQAAHLPMRGPIGFTVLVEGPVGKPLTWVAFNSPHASYRGSAFRKTRGFAAFDGREVDVLGFQTRYGAAPLSVRGRVALQPAPNAIEMLAHGGAPWLAIDGIALATADNPDAIALRGVLRGSDPAQRFDAAFNVSGDGTGSIGPLLARAPGGSLYARIALDHAHRTGAGIVDARNFPIAPLHARVDATLLGSERNARIALTGSVRLRGARTAGEARLGATIAGSPSSPQLSGTVVLANGRYDGLDVDANATVAYQAGALSVHDAALRLGPAFAALEGTIGPQLDLAAHVSSSDAGALLAIARPAAPRTLEGSVDADVRIGGAPSALSFSGSLSAPEGSLNGLAFRDLRASASGTMQSLSITGGHVVVGSTAVAFDGSAAGDDARVALAAPHADLADFDDFFDSGDTLAGTGSVALTATVAGERLMSSSGSAALTDARFRRIALGTVAARWHSAGEAVAGNVAFGGPGGEVAVVGSVVPSARRADLRASVRHADLSQWLPMLGVAAPLTGRLDADATVSGAYPDLAVALHAGLTGGTAGRFPIDRFTIVADAADGYGTIRAASLDVPWLSTTASGSFGLRPNDRLTLVAHSTSSDVGALLKEATGKAYDLSGTLDSALHVGGTPARPRVADDVVLSSLRYGQLVVPRFSGEIDADRTSLALRGGEADLQRGKLSLSAFARAGGPIGGSIVADDVEASNLLPLLQKGTHVAGRIDGRLTVAGTLAAPHLSGTIALANGAFIGPMEHAPIKDAGARLIFEGTHATLQSAHAFVGGGSVAAAGTASLQSLRSLQGLGFAFHASAENAHLEMPQYFQGNLNGDVSIQRRPGGPASASGQVAVSSARIPLSALYNPQTPAQAPRAPLPIAFDRLQISAGRDVRVQSQAVDIQATGSATLNGTLAAPLLAGEFHSRSGTIDFYRDFALQRASVTFDSAGVVPDVDAVATTYLADAQTDVRLHVTGPATGMNLALASEPSYDRQQILSLLLGIGNVQGVQQHNAFSVPGAAKNLALGQADQVFTRQLFEPLSTSVGAAMGFTDLAITDDVQSGLGLNAVKAFGKNVNAVLGESLGYPKAQSVALEAHPSVATALRMRLFSAQGPTLFAAEQPSSVGLDVLSLNPMTQLPGAGGTSGIDFSYVHEFP